jgi:hypothetical protein
VGGTVGRPRSAARARTASRSPQRDGRLVGEHAVWLCACETMDDSPIWHSSRGLAGRSTSRSTPLHQAGRLSPNLHAADHSKASPPPSARIRAQYQQELRPGFPRELLLPSTATGAGLALHQRLQSPLGQATAARGASRGAHGLGYRRESFAHTFGLVPGQVLEPLGVVLTRAWRGDKQLEPGASRPGSGLACLHATLRRRGPHRRRVSRMQPE